MHLAYVVGTYPKPSETFIAREIDGLRAREHRVEIYALYAPPEGPAAGVTYGQAVGNTLLSLTPVRRLAGFAQRHFSPGAVASRWRDLWQQQRYDAVVAHFGSEPSTVALEAVGDQPFFLSLHARDIYVEAERLEEKLARATAAVTCTRANMDYLRARYPQFAERIHLLYHGLPSAWLDAPVPARDRQPGEPLRLLAVGRLVEKKGFAILLDACSLLRDRGVAFCLRILGDGPLQSALEQQARALKITDAVSLPGWAAQEAVREAYAWADVCCCPSIPAGDGDRDGLPNVLVEALSTGLPAVGSNFTAIPEAIDDGVTGFLVPPGDVPALADALARLTDPALRSRMGTAGAAMVRERFDAEAGLDQLEEILRLAEPRRGGRR